MNLWLSIGRVTAAGALLWFLTTPAVVRGEPDARAGFLQAEQALKRGDRPAYEALREGLRDYPLFPALRFAELGDLETAPEPALDAFLGEFPDTPQAERARAVYLRRLARAGRWGDLVARYHRGGETAEASCLYLQALARTGAEARAFAADSIERLWLVPDAQPKACEPLFAEWRGRGGLTAELVWRRIRLALEAGEVGLARRLETWLPAAERSWLDHWLKVRGSPALVLRSPGGPAGGAADHPMAPAILADGIARLARARPQEAAALLEAQRPRLTADQAAWDLAHDGVAQALTRVGDPAGLAVWERIEARADNLDEQERRLRAAIGARDWRRVADWVRQMPERMEKRDRWLYWQGRAETALGQDTAARASLEAAAGQRSLWGLLAADRLGLPYRLDSRPVPAEPGRVARLGASPALARIREWQALGREADMRREWRTLTRNLDTPDLQAAATQAAGLGWHDQAILTLVRTNYWDDLELRFPLAYRDLVDGQASQTGLPPDWIFGVIRQESVFNPSAASPAGALGLMQLMPDTARELEAESGRPVPGRAAILEPARNIALGSGYLARMQERFGHPALATAAYNAGPQRVARWLPEGCTEADLWIVAIPFTETRGYVERVLSYRMIYRARLGLAPQRLSDLLPPVPPGSRARSDQVSWSVTAGAVGDCPAAAPASALTSGS